MMRRILITLRQPRWITLASMALMAGLAACSQPKHWVLQDINGLMPLLQFKLTDDTGKAVNASDYRGKIVLLYFGYTHCPDVCPLTASKFSAAQQTLGADAGRVRFVAVSVDPQGDTPQAVGAFSAAHDLRTHWD